MPVKMDWIIPGQVIYHRWWGAGTLDDIKLADQKMHDMYAQYPDRPLIHTLANGHGQEKIGVSLQEISKNYTILDHPQTGWIMLTANNPIIKFVSNIALQMGRKSRIRFINEIDEWQPFLKERDSTIDWSALDLSVIDHFEREVQNKKSNS